MDCTAEHRKRLHAFSLLELLVVIGVMFVIFGVFGPSLGCMSGTPKAKALRIACLNNLKQVGVAYRVFAEDNNGLFPHQVTHSIAYQDASRTWIHFQAMSNELATARVLFCPADKARSDKRADDFKQENPTAPKSLARFRDESLSYFVGIGAASTNAHAILAGDRNIAPRSNQAAYSSKASGALAMATNSEWSAFAANKLHEGQGNILSVDGSVQQASNSWLQHDLVDSMAAYGMGVNQFLFPQ